MPMSRKKCCVPGCLESGRSHKTLHSFPDPELDRERFNMWVFSIGGPIISLDNDFIFKQRRVCRAHFEEKFLCRSDRISNIALPTLNLPGFPNASVFQQTGRRPLGSMQNTSNALPSTSSALEYNFHSFEYEVKENIAPTPTTVDSVEASIPENIPVELSDGIKALATTSSVELNQEGISSYKEKNIRRAPIPTTVESIEASIPENIPVELSDGMKALAATSSVVLINQERISSYKEKNIRRGHCKKMKFSTVVKKLPKSVAERQLLKKLVALRSKLSKCRNKMRIKSASLKAAKRVSSNPAFVNTIEKLPSAGKILTLLQLREVKKKDKGRRFTIDEKIVALSMLKQSPKSYRFLRKIFILPAPQTLIKLLSRANITPGINKQIFTQLKGVAEKLKNEDKLCILMFDEMSLKANLAFRETQDEIIGFVTDGAERKPEYADHAQVFMIRGVTKNFKQVISYTFAQAATKGTELAKQIKTIIQELDQAGFIVVATVCDQGSNNRQAVKILTQEVRGILLRKQEEPKDNIFMVNNREIVPLFDPPHLMKCIRNNLMTKNLQYVDSNGKNCTAKWDHINEIHKENPGYKGIRLIPKLTDSHVLPHKINKMKVKYATQVFSRTVASNMGFLADKKILPKECQETADLLLIFDTLFDSVNGSFMKKDKQHGKPLLSPVTPNSSHLKFWHGAKKQITQMKFVNKITGNFENVPTLNNWVWTLDGIQILLKILQKKYNITSVWMRHFNQDPIENFFGAIRSHGCRNTNPTPDRFSSAFTTLMINNLSSVHAPGRNCERDLCENLQSFIIPGRDDCETVPACILENIPVVEIVDLTQKSDPRIIGPLQYVAGYFCRNVKKNVFKSCSTCKNNMIGEPADYIKYREYTGRQWLCSPTESLLICISEIQDISNDILKKSLNKVCVKEFIKTIILMYVNFDFITCPVHKEKVIEFLINSASKFFIHNYCKNINKILSGRRNPDDEDDEFQIKAKKYCHKCFKRRNK